MLESTDIVEHILVSHHHALGLTRRAAGIEDVGEVAYLIYIIVYILDAFVRHHKVTAFHHILDALLGERRFGWHISGTRLQRCQDGGNHLYRMAHHDAHLGRILYGEAIGNLSSHCVQFAISQAFLLVHHGYRIRMCRHLLFEYIINRLHTCLAFIASCFRVQRYDLFPNALQDKQRRKCHFSGLSFFSILRSAISDATRQSLSKLNFALAAPEIPMVSSPCIS